jgi:hypothetical protein
MGRSQTCEKQGARLIGLTLAGRLVTEEIDIHIMQRARRIIAESRALIGEVEKLFRRELSHSDFPITPPQGPPALR